jgi:tRNA-binding protein
MDINYSDFAKLDIRVGKIVVVEEFPEAKKPAYKLTVDFGSEIGQKKSSAQVKKYYTKETLLNRIVLGVVNFPPKQIGPFMSECLTLGVPDEDGQCVLISPSNDKAVIGGKMF